MRQLDGAKSDAAVQQLKIRADLSPFYSTELGSIVRVRAALQLTQAQFHCGKPPPAALPRIRVRINRSFRGDQIEPA